MESDVKPRLIAAATTFTHMHESFYVRAGKRCLDLVLAACGLLLLSPLLAAAAAAVKLSSRGPVFFRQVRVGRHSRPFQILKFRSMRIPLHPGLPLTASGDPRVTRIGAWLRQSKIDELPQLLNVVLGDMSLVGPRPEVPEFVARYSSVERGVFRTRPGITGPSVNVYEEELLAGLEDIEQFYVATVMPEKLAIDLAYCQHITLRMDLYILYQTFAKLLMRVYRPYKKMPHSAGTSIKIRAGEKRVENALAGTENHPDAPC